MGFLLEDYKNQLIKDQKRLNAAVKKAEEESAEYYNRSVAQRDLAVEYSKHRRIAYDTMEELARLDSYTTDQILGPGIFHPEPFDTNYEVSADGGACIVYRDTYYIDIYKRDYSLSLGNYEYVSQCLRELEAVLADHLICEQVTPYCELHG